MSRTENLAHFKITIAGATLAPSVARDVLDIEIDMAMGVPDMITVTMYDKEHVYLDGSLFKLGEEIEVSFAQGGTPQRITGAEIIALEPDMRGDMPTHTTIRALNKMNRLHYGRKTRSFANMKDSAIAAKIAQEMGLAGQTDATTTTHEYVVQWNQTNMEFLTERARRNGYNFWTDNQKLFFKKVNTSGSPAVTLKFLESLSSFRPRLSLAHQVAGTRVSGWNPDSKQEIAGTSTTTKHTSPATKLKQGSAWASTLASGSQLAVIDPLVVASDEATAYATALAEEISRDVMEAEAECMGDPAIKPGVMVKIENVSSNFNGNYYVVSVKHRYNRDGYGCQLSLSSSRLPTIGGLLGQDVAPPKVTGVMPAIVTNLNDPKKMGRVKVKFPAMPQNEGSPLESFWIRVATPMTGNARGIFFMPEVNDEVLVAFDGGEPAQGYIVGSLWNGQDKTPIPTYFQNGIHERIIKTRSGHTLTFNDKSGEEKITLKDKAGNQLLLDAANKKVTLESTGDMDITVAGNLKIKTTGNYNVESTGSLGLKSTQATTIESTAGLTIKANATLSIQGSSTVEVKANAMLGLSSSGIAELKGSLVKIN